MLDKEADEFGGNTLLLDCDSALYSDLFDDDGQPNSGAVSANEWHYSDLREGLNGIGFLTKENNFSSPEKDAIAESIKTSRADGDGTLEGTI